MDSKNSNENNIKSSNKTNAEKYALSEKEFQMLEEYANIEIIPSVGDKLEPTDICTFISRVVLSDDEEEFVSFTSDSQTMLQEMCAGAPTLKEVLELGFRYFISNGSETCACNLGALFYSGIIFNQDYARAKELYELAASLGSGQALINLGYIYEYGRVGEPNYTKAYEIYSRAAALLGNFEALYKLGDMYSRGRGVEPNLNAASDLWIKSYDVAESRLEKGHAAFRLAKVFASSTTDAEEYGLKHNPFTALMLFQEAEMAFRLEIENGASYYAKNLQATIEGQDAARLELDGLE